MNRVNQNVMLNLVDEIAIVLTQVENHHARDAMASLYELRLMLVAEGVISNGDHSVLPKLVDPVTREPKTGVRVKTVQVACPLCLAKPGQGCWRMSGRGLHCTPTDQPLMYDGKRGFHDKRVQLARARSGL